MSSDTKEQILEVKDLEVIYKNDFETVYPLNKVSFTLHKGETMGLVGETGAGKTTTALSILRLLPKNIGEVTGGSITLDGEDILSLKESEMRKIRGDVVSMIFQDPMTSLNPTMTVGEQIAEALELHNEEGRSKAQIQDRVKQMLELVGIQPERKDDFPHQFAYV